MNISEIKGSSVWGNLEKPIRDCLERAEVLAKLSKGEPASVMLVNSCAKGYKPIMSDFFQVAAPEVTIADKPMPGGRTQITFEVKH